ncbi:MAG: CNNM domain-containing protein [Planctomycetota bacterium]|jgi:CBS domain containing-hemolysin-like protein
MVSIVLVLAIFLAVVLGGLFSGSETGIYQLSRLRLRLGYEERRILFVMLANIMRDSSSLLISMLIGTNLTCYITTSIVTYMLLSRFQVGYAAEFFATIITAPALFVFSDLIPKNIFYYRADSLMPSVAPVLLIFHKFFTWCGIVPLLRLISRAFAKLTGSASLSKVAVTTVYPSHIKAIFQETHEEGLLSPVQTDIINRIESILHLRIQSVMTPINKTQTISKDSTNEILLDKLKKHAFTRLLVYEEWAGNIVGFVDIYECLNSAGDFSNLNDFLKPIRELGSETTVSDALNIMRSENQKIVLVAKMTHAGRKKPIGIVTMKDLVEELLGELSEW